MTILIADDHPTNRKLLRAVLEAERHAVLEAEDGEEALAVLANVAADAVITDVLMPKIANVKLMADASDTSKAIGTLARTDELVVIGGEKDGFINVQGANGAGWVKIVLVNKR